MKPLDPSESSTPDADLIEIHRAVLREPPDPEEGRERGPWWLWVSIIFAIFGGGFYLGRFSGAFFENAVHVGYLRPTMLSRDPTGPGGLAPVAKESLADIGPRVYKANCITCHQINGQGVPGSFPPLAGSSWVNGEASIPIRIVLHGLQGSLTVSGQTYNGAMPAWQTILSDEQIAGVVSYIRSEWGNTAGPVTVDEVARLRQENKDRTQPWTAQELESVRPQ